MAEFSDGSPIIFYDGECGFCNKSVQFIMKHDSKGAFFYAPLQGETAEQAHVTPTGDPANWSIILVDEKGTHDKSTAALRISSKLNGFWSLLALFLIVPRGIRDWFYDVVAHNRYRIAGRTPDACALPPLTVRQRLLP